MRIALAQLNYHIGNFEGNTEKMIRAIEEARLQGADMICFGELALCGYPPRDFLEFDDFIRLAQDALMQLAEAAKEVAVVVGCPAVNPVPEGKDLYNTAYVLAEGKVIHQARKALLPTYDIFDEYRYFEPAKEFQVFTFKGKRIALTICEDIWNIGNENPLYTVCPMDEMIHQQPDFMINISASPFAYDHAEKRVEIVEKNAIRYNLPVFYVNHVGAQTELIFDGGSLVAAPDGTVVCEMSYFKEELRVFELDSVLEGSAKQVQEKQKFPLIHEALLTGIRDYFNKLGFEKAVLGLSGGIDSAVTAVLAAQALGSRNVRMVLMPSQYSSRHSVDDAKELAINLGVDYDIIPIEQAYRAIESTMDPIFGDLPFNLTEENIQARCRGIILMAISNKFGNILLNTSNKSEAAVGYGTLYGDMAGGLSVIGDLYKTEVWELARYLNRAEEIIPEHTIIKPPSAELRPDQKDADSLPPYKDLDEILFQYIEREQGPKEIIRQGFDEKLVNRILRLVNINEFKRHQTAPVLRVSSKAFGMGRRMPIVAKYLC
ncbi:MAG: NAD+ synthase [Saprospiraceae bacterium]|nr:NAD+ synthase [Saprospiraceae bacterium]